MPKEELSDAEKVVLESIKEFYNQVDEIKVLDLVAFIQKKTGMKPKDVVETLITVEEKGMIKLVEEEYLKDLRAEKEAVNYPEEILELKTKIDKLRSLIIRTPGFK